MLNAYFVPVHVDGTFVQSNPQKAGKELTAYRTLFAELHRANRERKRAGQSELSVGTVHAYVFAPDGQAVDSRHVAHAGPASMIDMLERAVKDLGVRAGKAVVPPSTQLSRPVCTNDALVLHLTARYLVPRNRAEARRDVKGELVPYDASKLGGERSGQWHALPSEDWIVLRRDQWTRLLPEGRVDSGSSWQVDAKLTDTLLTRFYPTTELNDLSKNRIQKRSLKMTVLTVEKDRVRARIDGRLVMKHPFYPGRDDDNVVKATVIGVIEFDRSRPRVHSLQIVTDRATYGSPTDRTHPFGVAVRNVP